MTEAQQNYERFKKHLARQGRTVTEYAASIGTGVPQVINAFTKYAGSDRLPTDPRMRKVVEAVEADYAALVQQDTP